uniref:Uncharacterized protein n=1 Tax=Arundo donax TaxID=35708 RepID=A0A0A9GAY0_ARUDO
MKKQKVAEEEGEPSIGMEEVVVSDDGESRKGIVLEDKFLIDDNQEVKEDESIVSEDNEKSAFTTNTSVQVELEKENEADPQEFTLHEELEILDELHEEKEEDMENGSASCADENYADKTEEDNILSEDGVPIENRLTSAFEHDLLWGWKALQQLLMSLGFKMDTT